MIFIIYLESSATLNTSTMTVAVVSSVVVILLASAVFFIVGFFCGRLSRQDPCSCGHERPVDREVYSEPTDVHVLYEDILGPGKPQQDDTELVLEENVAYGHALERSLQK